MTLARAVDTASHDALAAWSGEATAAANIARALAPTPFVPYSLRVWQGKAGDSPLDLQATTAVVAAALLTGSELGLEPMASLRSIDVVRGTPALRALALRALLQQRGHRIWLAESTKTRCVMRGQRAGDEFTQEVTWTIDRAKDLRIVGFDDPRGSWKRQPQNMLIARATAELARLIAADAILGLPYIVEEIDDLDGAEPAGNPPAAPAPPPTKRTARRRSPPPSGAPAGGAPLTPTRASPFGDEPDLDEAKPAGTGEPEPPMITPAQLKALHAGLRDLGITDRDEGLATISGWIGRDITSTKDLYRAEGIQAIDAARAVTEARDTENQAAEHDRQVQAELADWMKNGDQPDPEAK